MSSVCAPYPTAKDAKRWSVLGLVNNADCYGKKEVHDDINDCLQIYSATAGSINNEESCRWELENIAAMIFTNVFDLL